MTDREKLVELLKNADDDACPGLTLEDCESCRYVDSDNCFAERFADYLIANGVTVQKVGKWETYKYPPIMCCSECDWGTWIQNDLKYCPYCGAKLDPPNANDALTNGAKKLGVTVQGNAHQHESNTHNALTNTHNALNGVTARWIPASEPPKEYRDKYEELIPFLVCAKGTEYPFRALYDGKRWGDGIDEIDVTHWMPLPKVPKEEE